MPALLTASSVILCIHGGTVTAVTSNTRTRAAGDFVLRSSDTFVVSGCPFTPVLPHPCVMIQWVQADTRSQVLGEFTLDESSIGLCIAADQAVQGIALIAATQPLVSGQ
jgi:hypothetical protein